MKKILLLLLLLPFTALAQIALPSIDKSGTVTTGGTFQTVTNPSGLRQSLDFMNVCNVSGNCTSAADVCYLHFGTDSATTANSIVVNPGQEYLRASGAIPNDTLQVSCTTTGDKFYLKLQ